MSNLAWMIVAILLGMIGGGFHQAMDRGKENTVYAWIRSVLIGGIAGFFAGLAIPSGGNEVYYASFAAGYFGDSFVLNIIERHKPTQTP